MLRTLISRSAILQHPAKQRVLSQPMVNSLRSISTTRPLQKVYSSSLPDIDLPTCPLPDFLIDKFLKYGDKVALVDGSGGASHGQTLTYSQLVDNIMKTAAGLHKAGFKKGDVLCIHSPNNFEYPIISNAVLLLGGVVTPVSPLATADDLALQLNDSGTSFVVSHPVVLDNMKKALERVPNVRHAYVIGSDTKGATKWGTTEKLRMGMRVSDVPKVNIDPDSVAILPYSSGTTGLPKGVMLSHNNLVRNICQALQIHKVTAEDVSIAVLPFFHIYALQVLMNAGLYVGSTQVVMPKFDLEQYLKNISGFRASSLAVAPPIVLGLLKSPMVRNYDISSVRLIMSAAAPLSGSTQQEAMDKLKCVVKQGYGMTELSPVTHVVPEDFVKVGTAGVLLPNTQAMIVDLETGKPLPPNQPGELWIKGPQVMMGYLNRPEATKETITPEGWLRTGDIGFKDNDGFLTVTDRLKELIKVKGYQVPPAELEGKFLSHPDVADVAVIGVSDPRTPEIEFPKAFIVLKPGLDTSKARQILAEVNEKMPYYKHTNEVEVIKEIPKSAAGKILRRVLVQQERQNRAARL